MAMQEYLKAINNSLKDMDLGNYESALTNLQKIINNQFFKNLTIKDKLFIKKRLSWMQLSLGYYDQGWDNFTYNWLKNEHKFVEIKKRNNSIKYLINFNQIKKGDRLLIWNDGGYGDYIYQLRLLKYIQKKIDIKIYNSKMDHLVRNKKIITNDSNGFDWHLPLNEMPRIINFNPDIHKDFQYDYLVLPKSRFDYYKEHIALTYKTENSVHRSIPYKLLEKIFIKDKNKKFLILHKYLDEYEKSFFSNFKNVSWIESLDKSLIFQDTFEILYSTKYVISVDTAITHIAGYFGKKNFLLSRHPGTFYWGFRENKSKDYPNTLILRQKETDNWDSVIIALLNKIN
tara:strand:+ start:675 stop:1703 length:1029 start_codon:yes stop_codon:yes gene_type:complete